MKQYDLHIHTHYSSCSNLKPEKILKYAKRKNLDGIAITDHHTIRGALEVQKINDNPELDIIIGEEFETENGHVIGYFLKKEIKPGKFKDVVREIKKQGGIAAAAHPYDFGRRMKRLEEVKLLDAIEVLNGRMRTPFGNKKAKELAETYSLGKTAGSDAHFFFEIGKARAVFEGRIRKSILNGSIKPEGWGVQNPLAGLMSMISMAFRKLNPFNRIKH